MKGRLSMRVLSLKFSVLVLLLVSCLTDSQAQKKVTKLTGQEEAADYVVDRAAYDQVLGIVFPRKVLTGATGYALILRYEPSFEEESQITILGRAGKIEIVEYRPVNGSIYRQLKKILKRVGDFNTKEAAKRIQIRRRVLNVPANLAKELQESFYDRLCRLTQREKDITSAETINVIEDGTQYRLWYRGEGLLQFEIIGSSVDSQSLPDENPLLGWMKDTYRIIKKLPATTDNMP
jgi:hypothetical protein